MKKINIKQNTKLLKYDEKCELVTPFLIFFIFLSYICLFFLWLLHQQQVTKIKRK